MSEVSAFPLCWPAGQKRTPFTVRSRFDASRGRTRAEAIEELLNELSRLKGSDVILSSNLKLKQDGLPYSNQRQPDDQGIAVYFNLKGRPMCFACDKFDRDVDNIWAIKLTIEAIRGIERWGSSDMMERAFTGFAQLPAPEPGYPDFFAGCDSQDARERRFRELAMEHHPDKGGDAAIMAEINRQREALK